MKALTLHQPWASLVALGAKTVETRSWSTSYRGPLAIHAGRRQPEELQWVGDWFCTFRPTVAVDDVVCPGRWIICHEEREEAHPLPLGAVVATCTLVDVVPMVEDYEAVCHAYDGPAALEITPSGMLLLFPEWGGALDEDDERDVSDQRPFGDFSPGRFAWLLANIEPLAEPFPARGYQGLWSLDCVPDSSEGGEN